MTDLFKQIKHDLPASIVVFFVAVPLCLGIALASGAPLFAGLIAGIVGGIVVGAASGSPLGVSGPAAGLAVIVLSSIGTLGGSWEAFLVAVILAGILQIAMGSLGLGGIAYYFPSSVIKGMLTGIGLLIIIKQIPQALGSVQAPGDALIDSGGNSIHQLFRSVAPAALFVTTVSLVLLISWDTWLAPRLKLFRMIPGPLAAVATGILLSRLMAADALPWALDTHQLVAIPLATSVREFLAQFSTPDFSALANRDVYAIAVVLAAIASIETLLCVEATDRLDPEKRITPTNRELKAQGLGNIVSGLIGGLPVTQVIVRSSANITFGGRTKLSAILHGVFILLCVAALPQVLNMIPLATLAAILFVVGYKLAKPALFTQMYRHGWEQFVPFVATVAGILATDLLRGIGIGLLAGVAIVLHHNLRNPFTVAQHVPDTDAYRIKLAEEVSFLNKGRILQQLASIPAHSRVVIDASQSKVVDFDVREILREFRSSAAMRAITVEFHGSILDSSTA
ncbi:SulP family inorganic anion transporter [Gemmatimonas sp.]|uniref:SulP family inorganic anion transporter n=1 Tax=Gemmatimonas sp. TaxID=1962908 RepID=UPI00286BED93|nr:SulP family inorganic anion transporter [Gemmatimonas sp.]